MKRNFQIHSTSTCSSQHALISSAKPSNSRMRIADIINLAEDQASDGDDCGTAAMTNLQRQPSEASFGLACVSPPRIVSRLMRRLKDRGRPTQWKERGQSEKDTLDQPRNVKCSLVEARFDRSEEFALAGPSSSGTGECGEVAMSNIGAGLSLLDLIASCKDELSKLREARLEMQLLLHNTKQESQRRDYGCEKEESEESIGSSLTILEEAPGCSNVTSSRSNTFPYVITREENAIIISEKECQERMELLEAELEAELELLWIQCDAESCSESMKVDDMNDVATSREEVVNLREATPEIYDGVPPVELERRLHELIESQQQEKIKELETAVECLKKKVREKEGEVVWWKDTALLVSRHVLQLQGRW